MTGQGNADGASERLLEEAADWLVGLVSGRATPEDATRLAAWRARSTAHEAAFREVAGVRSYAVIASQSTKPVDRRTLLAAAGGGALALFAGIGLARPPLGLWPSYDELMADHRTAIGSRLALQPTPGVDVELSSRTAVSLIDDGHGMRLISGISYVAAGPQAGIFRVRTKGVRIAARDADFNVQALANHERVACVRGTIRCEIAGRLTVLAANQALWLDADGIVRRGAVDAGKESAWRHGLLVFEGTPLGDVVDQINLYRPGRVVLTNARLGELPLNAVFHIAQIDNSIAQIEQLANVHARYVAGGVVLLG